MEKRSLHKKLDRLTFEQTNLVRKEGRSAQKTVQLLKRERQASKNNYSLSLSRKGNDLTTCKPITIKKTSKYKYSNKYRN